MQTVSQIIGIVASVTTIITFQMPKRWQMLLTGMVANLLSMLAFLLLNGFSNAVTVNLIAVVQCAINAYLYYHEKKPPLLMKFVFLVLFLVSGFLRYTAPLDLLPIAASILFMCSAFQRDEQTGRVWSIFNVSTWIAYDLIVGTTAVFGQMFSLASIFVGLYRYRGQKSVKKKETRAI